MLKSDSHNADSARPAAARVTLRDVAKAAFVSVSTASMALRGNTTISEDTRNRVLQVADELGYRPDPAAQALRGRRDGTAEQSASVGMLVEQALRDPADPSSRLFLHRLTSLLTEALAQRHVSVQPIADPHDQRVKELDVVIVVGEDPLPDGWDEALRRTKVIAAGYDSGAPDTAAVVVHDHAAIAESIIAHLRSQGARSVAVLCDEQRRGYTKDAADELQHCARKSGIDLSVQWVLRTHDAFRSAATQAVKGGADAIYSMVSFPNSVLSGIRDAGANCPNDVLLICQSEGTYEAELDPPVTHLSLRGVESGRLLVSVLDRVLSGETGIRVYAPYDLVVCASSLRS